MSPENNRGIWGVLLLVFSFFVILIIFATYHLKELGKHSNDFLSGAGGSGVGEIAVVEVEGVIYRSEKIVEKLHQAEKDKSIKAIILRINSPGGAVGPTQEIYEEVIRIDKDKPVYASFESVAASGGYYIAAATRKIYTNAGSLTGSIGVIMEFMDLSKLYEFAKIKPTPLKAGKYKDIGHPYRAMSEEEKFIMDKMMKGVHEQFKEDISRRRKDKLKEDINELAQGQVFSGREAVKLGLADKVGSLWQAGREIHKELKLTGDFKLRFLRKKKKLNPLELFENLEGKLGNFEWRNLFEKSSMIMFK